MEHLLEQILRADVTTRTGLVLIPSGTKLNQGHLKLLNQHQISPDEVITRTPEMEDQGAAKQLQQATSYVKDLFHRVRSKGKIPILEVKHELTPMIQETVEAYSLFDLMNAVKVKDEYIFQHQIGVGVWATLLGKWLGLAESELSLLSLAASLHDMGKVKISDEILQKPGRLTASEFDEMKRHTIYGYEMLKECTGLNPRVALVALQHHERDDGRGYPLSLRNNQLEGLSRIVAVADVFHAMTSKRPYHEPLSFHEALNRMRDGIFGQLDPHVVSLFLKQMVHHMIGQKVLLSDGQIGEIVYINPHDDTKPLVKVKGDFIDLSKLRNVRIQEVIA